MNLRVGSQESRSPTLEDAGTNPQYNFKSMLSVSIADQCVVSVIEHHAMGDRGVGNATLAVAAYTSGDVADMWLPLMQGAEKMGEVRVRVQLMHQGQRPLHAPAGAASPAAVPGAASMPPGGGYAGGGYGAPAPGGYPGSPAAPPGYPGAPSAYGAAAGYGASPAGTLLITELPSVQHLQHRSRERWIRRFR